MNKLGLPSKIILHNTYSKRDLWLLLIYTKLELLEITLGERKQGGFMRVSDILKEKYFDRYRK